MNLMEKVFGARLIFWDVLFVSLAIGVACWLGRLAGAWA
jgi:hypothetical protein